MNTRCLASFPRAYYAKGSFGVYQLLLKQQQINSSFTKTPSSLKSRFKKSPSAKLLGHEARKALVISTDPSLQRHFLERLIQYFNFEIIEFVRDKKELVAKANHKYLWVIASEDFNEVGLSIVAKLFSRPSENLLLLVGNINQKDAEALGFDVALRKLQLAWDVLN